MVPTFHGMDCGIASCVYFTLSVIHTLIHDVYKIATDLSGKDVTIVYNMKLSELTMDSQAISKYCDGKLGHPSR